jgi:hypothetical protein
MSETRSDQVSFNYGSARADGSIAAGFPPPKVQDRALAARVIIPWLTADEATTYMGFPTRKALYAAVERGQVPAHKLGRRLRFRARGSLGPAGAGSLDDRHSLPTCLAKHPANIAFGSRGTRLGGDGQVRVESRSRGRV